MWQVLVDEEMLREQRGGREASSAARKGAPVALLDPQQYASMHPEEHAELTLGGFKMSCAENPRLCRDGAWGGHDARADAPARGTGRYATLGPRRPESQ